MTVGLVKIICERNYGNPKPSPNDPIDLRVFHVKPEDVEEITGWFELNNWMVTKEPI